MSWYPYYYNESKQYTKTSLCMGCVCVCVHTYYYYEFPLSNKCTRRDCELCAFYVRTSLLIKFNSKEFAYKVCTIVLHVLYELVESCPERCHRVH